MTLRTVASALSARSAALTLGPGLEGKGLTTARRVAMAVAKWPSEVKAHRAKIQEARTQLMGETLFESPTPSFHSEDEVQLGFHGASLDDWRGSIEMAKLGQTIPIKGAELHLAPEEVARDYATAHGDDAIILQVRCRQSQLNSGQDEGIGAHPVIKPGEFVEIVKVQKIRGDVIETINNLSKDFPNLFTRVSEAWL